MDDNRAIFSGSVKFVKSNRIGSNLWGNLTVKIIMDNKTFMFKEKAQFLSEPIIWMSIKTNFLENGKLEGNSEKVFDACTNKKYILVTGAKLSDYERVVKDDNGVIIPNGPKLTTYTLECSTNGAVFSTSPFAEINHCTIEGYVNNIIDENSFELKIPYRAKNETKYRKCIIFCDNDKINEYKGKKVFIIGKVFGKTPDPSKKDLIYIVCNNPIITQ